ncbi:DNA polymerase III subunit alpha [Phocaeicola oris]|uniref:DNA polymerase III subunit alpha n=1 Tax=Phocaeicola oris TaxID=2896850 RepID=UPI00234EAC57|nr:DNA polymerase III subunit alpha [Phocaeicola oris]MCE2616867.1 DNA polymerase III subunit alpha [Phocaeicola oris]
MEDFVHLHVHTHYSILDGMSRIPKLVNKAITDGMKGLAITDHGNMFSIKEFFDYCNKINDDRKKEGKELFKPIFGCEMYVAHHNKEDKVKENGDISGYHLIVLAKNKNGYKNLIKLVSRSWVDGFYQRPRTDRKDLEKYHEDLIVCSACIAGEVPSKILKGDMKGAREAIEWYHNLFGDDYYLEIQRHEVTNPNIHANRDTYPLQQKANKVIFELAKEYGIKVICTNDCHFVDEDDAEAHDILLCLSTGKDLDDPTRMLYSKQEWFKTKKEMNEIFADVPETLSNTLEILNKVETYSIDMDPIMPFFPIPKEFGTEEDVRKKYTEKQLYDEFTSDENGENQLNEETGKKKIEHLGGYDKLYRIKFEAEYLAKLAYDGAKKRYGDPIPQEVFDRIKFELHVMKTMGFPGYFLIVQDFINAARNELGVMVGPGRGSAAGSVVAYCLGITKIDPIKYDLLFERFLNPDRISLPDIDTDFDDDGRGKVLNWVADKYGHENCAHIITYASMATKNSIKDVARVEKVPLDTANKLCKDIPDRLPDGLKMNLTNAIKCTPSLQEAEVATDKNLSDTIKYAKKLEGTIRGTGIHACGFIICRGPISDWVPLSTADDPDFPGKKTNCTQYDGHVIESTGLIKMDFLGLKTLSELKEAVQNIHDTVGADIDLDTIPIDDELTYKLYQEGRTIGTFQFESPGMQKYLRELKPTVFEDLIAMNALYRPGPMDYIPSFIARKNGKEEIKYDIPCMEKYLKDTYGITVYQEQVMLLSRQLANFTRGESDALRKAMGKKKKAIVDAMKPKFIKQGQENGYDPKILEKIWSDWEKFASYAFNKSHATCYSWVAYQTAYLKAHYPAEFMAAIMSRRKNDIKEITKLMAECKSLGIPTLGPDVNESRLKFSANKKGEIRFGMGAVKGVGEAAVESIVEEREKNGPFKSIFDFVQRVNLSACNKKTIESLALAGAFDNFKEIHREDFFVLNSKGEMFSDILVRYGVKYQADQQSSANSLFGDMGGIEIATPEIQRGEAWSDLERLNKERDLVGIYLSAHPLDEYAVILENVCNVRMTDLDDLSSLYDKDITVGGIVTETKQMTTKRGNPMGKVKIEDYSGAHEFVFFDRDWLDKEKYFAPGMFLFMRGRCQPKKWRQDEYEIAINTIELLPEVKERAIQKLMVKVPLSCINEDFVAEFNEQVKDNPGNAELCFMIFDDDQVSQITMSTRKGSISVHKELMDFLDSQPRIDYQINDGITKSDKLHRLKKDEVEEEELPVMEEVLDN